MAAIKIVVKTTVKAMSKRHILYHFNTSIKNFCRFLFSRSETWKKKMANQRTLLNIQIVTSGSGLVKDADFQGMSVYFVLSNPMSLVPKTDKISQHHWTARSQSLTIQSTFKDISYIEGAITTRIMAAYVYMPRTQFSVRYWKTSRVMIMTLSGPSWGLPACPVSLSLDCCSHLSPRPALQHHNTALHIQSLLDHIEAKLPIRWQFQQIWLQSIS